MKLALAATFALVTAASAQKPASIPFDDPANLRGERIAPHTGRELPIDQPEARGGRGLEQMLRRLNTRASLMLIVAHPDDEDGGLLTFYSRGMGARVADLSLTRGEGGQNAMTGDFEDALGLIRTEELLSSDRYTGVDQFFGTEVDFGFSKTKEEAFAKWTHERVLYDAVRAVRLYRPLVIAAVFIGGVTDGHGQHQVSGQIAQEVFKAAADPTVFPELTRQGIPPWQPLKVYARVPTQSIGAGGLFDYATGQYAPARFTNYVTGKVTVTPPSVDVTVHEGQIDPLLSGPGEPPRSFVQFARIGLGLQKTQIGPGVRLAVPGAFDIGYHRYGSRLPAAAQPSPESSFFDGIDTTLDSIGTLSSAPPPALLRGVRAFSAAMKQAAQHFDSTHPDALAPELAQAQEQLSKLLYGLEETNFSGKVDVLHELRIKQVQLNEAIVDALGLQLKAEAVTPQPDVIQGRVVAVRTTLSSASSQSVGIFAESLESFPKASKERLLAINAEPTVSAHQPFAQTLQSTEELSKTPTRPYFLRTDIEQPIYQLLTPALRNAPAAPPALTALATLRFHGVEVQLGRIVTVGDQPLRIVPPLSVALSQHAQALPDDRQTLDLSLLTFPANRTGTAPHLALPAGWSATASPGTTRVDTEQTAYHLHALSIRAPIMLHASATLPDGLSFDNGYRPVGYGDLPRTNFYTPATDRIVPLALHLPTHRRIGYLPGTGDAVPETLASLNLPVSILSTSDLTPEHLARFDTVILGVRTYNAHPDLHGAPTAALLTWARAGGNMVVQYQSAEFTAADAPYPLSLGSSEKVVDETAPVQLLTPQNFLLTSPNRIAPADFQGWIEERGHGFLYEWDPHYTALTETHDPGQTPQKGGLVTTQLGRGHWTYCAFALYRQLPEAVPGATRLFVNLLGLADESRP